MPSVYRPVVTTNTMKDTSFTFYVGVYEDTQNVRRWHNSNLSQHAPDRTAGLHI